MVIEKYWSVPEIARLLHLSRDYIRRTFMNEPGVLKVKNGAKTVYRVPESVLERVVRRSTNPPGFR